MEDTQHQTLGKRYNVRVSVVKSTHTVSSQSDEQFSQELDDDQCTCTPAKTNFVHSIANPCAAGPFIQDSCDGQAESLCGEDSNVPDLILATSSGGSSSTESSDLTLEEAKQLESQSLFHPFKPRIKPPRSCDLVVSIEKEDFFYSSGILSRYTDYLSKDCVERDWEGRYYLNFPLHSVEEWRPFVGFIQSYYVGASRLSWNLLPSLLPWFHELGMTELIHETDAFLVKATQDFHDKEDVGDLVDVSSILLLTKIAYTCDLRATQTRVRKWLKKKLQEPRDDSQEGEDDDDVPILWSLNDLQMLSDLMRKYEDFRNYLWASTISLYLPHDLDVSDGHGLVRNPLFPYLLREGILQLAILSKVEMGFEDASRLSYRTNVSNKTSSSATTLPTHHLETKATGSLSREVVTSRINETVSTLEHFRKTFERMNSSYSLKRGCKSSFNSISQEKNDQSTESDILQTYEYTRNKFKC